jgi:hypothetical protein
VARNVDLYNSESVIGYGSREPPNKDLVGFGAGDLFVCGDRVTDLHPPALESAACDGLGHLGHFNRFRYE